MLVTETTAKSVLIPANHPDRWFGVRYNMNIYRGCTHGCIYCDSRSECYGIDHFEAMTVKSNAIELLRKELASKREKGTIGTGSMSDPYNPHEAELGMTRKALEIIAAFGFPAHINTKSDLILRDIDLLQKINRTFASVALTLTTCDDDLAAQIEPNAPRPTMRLNAMKALAEAGIYVGVLMMPILPFIEDNRKNIAEIVQKTADHGGRFIHSWLGMSLRDRQREYYYACLERLFLGISEQYRRKYGNEYNCMSPDYRELDLFFREKCRAVGVVSEMREIRKYVPEQREEEQLKLF